MSEVQGPKKKGKKGGGGGGDGGAATASQSKQVVPAGSIEASLFPAKPVRPQDCKAPGNFVRLITNLFKISLKQEKKIYRYTIEIDAVVETGGEVPKIPRKIAREIRQSAVQKAVKDWINNNDRNKSIRSLTYSYVLDTNASTMFALFDMDLKPTGKQDRKKTEIDVTIPVPYLAKDAKVVEDKTYTVKIHDGSPLDVRELMDYCIGKGSSDHDKYRDHIRALNVIFLGEIITVPRYLVLQNAKAGHGSIFPLDNQSQFVISEGVVANKGFTTSVRPTEGGLVLNVANTVMAFYQPWKLTDLLQKRFRVNNLSGKLSAEITAQLTRELVMKQVEATHINYGTQQRPHFRKYRVKEIGTKSANEDKFDLNGKMTSVADYFEKEYKVKLRYPNLPCVIDNGRKIPLELCQLVDKQKVLRKLDPMETSEVIKKAAMRPRDHFDAVQKSVNQVCQHSQSCKDFGLEINPVPIEVTGRELPPIQLLGGKQARINASGGQYMLASTGFVKPTQINKWAMVVLVDFSVKRCYASSEGMKQDCARFSDMYARAGQQKGAQIRPTQDFRFVMIDADLKKKLRTNFEDFNSSGVDMVLFLLPAGSPDWAYSYLQYLEATVKGTRKADRRCTRIACLKFENFKRKILEDQRGASMFLSNLWLKHNTKLGGVNIVLDSSQTFSIQPKHETKFLTPGYLFVSVDVCHPAPGDRLKQSVAAAVGMWNLTNPNMSYCTRLRVQRKDKSDQDKSTVEEVGEVGIMFEEILSAYKQKQNNALPTHVVILRDGVSEGQFKMVLQKELVQIKQVIDNTYKKSKVKSPPLTCLTVQKRHKVRFMRKEGVKDRKGNLDFNIQPGTVVDAEITPANAHSFYLAPHKAIQGTARAPYIYMIYDEIKFSQDSAQAMIHALSYLSPRCTKGTSIPTPVNLADLAAERGKNVVVSWNEENTNKMSDGERLVKLNAFLSNMGDEQYKNALFYI